MRNFFDRLGADRVVLQIGCGIGRFEAALAGSVKMAYGVQRDRIQPIRLIDQRVSRSAHFHSPFLFCAPGRNYKGPLRNGLVHHFSELYGPPSYSARKRLTCSKA